MVKRDLKAKYAGSILGFVWSIIQPLTMLLIYYFVFSAVLKVRLGVDDSNPNFLIWLMCGLFPWIFLSEIIGRSSSVLLENASLITKLNFSSEVLPLVLVISSFVNHMIAMSLLFFIGISFKFIILNIRMILFLLYTFYAGIIGLSLGWIVSSLNVFIRDIAQVVSVILNIWFYATPIVYPGYQIPEKVLTFMRLNPLYFIVEGYRGAILGYQSIDYYGIKFLTLTSIILFILGGMIFKYLKRDFANVL
ncbi:Teichoic acid translocation permease protein TagG [Thermotalea metallivorans]|uniref:Transport permease protein n=2 Tax=Thermotalea metallivorans TaxID=520762 RepID=A0A140L6V8_9FIRM|nr:Teichoic acid translocation permease protein TagG [Thermotalea metallivorans]